MQKNRKKMHYSTILTGKITVACKVTVGGKCAGRRVLPALSPSPAGRRAGAGGGTVAGDSRQHSKLTGGTQQGAGGHAARVAAGGLSCRCHEPAACGLRATSAASAAGGVTMPAAHPPPSVAARPVGVSRACRRHACRRDYVAAGEAGQYGASRPPAVVERRSDGSDRQRARHFSV